MGAGTVRRFVQEGARVMIAGTTDDRGRALAHHYSHSKNTEKTLEFSRLAGQWAAQRSANVEAIRHLTTGLELLKSFPETLERTRRELELQIALGAPLASRGRRRPPA